MQFIVNKKTAWFCDMTALYATRRGSAKELYGCAEDGSATLALRHAWLRWKQQWIGRQMRVYRSLTPTQVNRHFKHHYCLKRGAAQWCGFTSGLHPRMRRKNKVVPRARFQHNPLQPP